MVKRVVSVLLSAVVVFGCAATRVFPVLTVHASGAEAAVTAWEVLQMILMSAGVTLQTVSSGGTEITDEEYYRAFMAEQADQAWCDAVDSAIDTALAKGSGTAALTVSLADDVWDSFRNWVSDAAQSGQDILLGILDSPVEISGYLDFQGIIGYEISNTDRLDSFINNVNLNDGQFSVIRANWVDSFYPSSPAAFYIIGSQNGGSAVGSVDITDKSGTYYYYLNNTSLPFSYVELSPSGSGFLCNAVKQSAYGSAYLFNSSSRQVFTNIMDNSQTARESLGLISDVFYAEVLGKAYDVVTPGRSKTAEGVLEGDVTLTIPAAMSIAETIAAVKADTLPIPEALAQVGVVPVDMTKKKVIGRDETLDDAIAATESTGISTSLLADLSGIFPFCIPFDVYDFCSILAAEPEAPSFEYEFPYYDSSGKLVYYTGTISFEAFDPVAFVVRKLELLLFIVGLAFATRNFFIRG